MVVLQYPEAAAAVTALDGITFKDTGRTRLPIRVRREEQALKLSQILHEGEFEQVSHPRLESAWAVVFIDEKIERDRLTRYMGDIRIIDRSVFDEEIPGPGRDAEAGN